MMLQHILYPIVVTLLVLQSTAPAVAQGFDVSACFAGVEDLNQAMEESQIAEADRNSIDQALNRVVLACEADKLKEGEQALTDANQLYEGAMATLHGDVTLTEFWQRADYMWGHRSHLKGVDYRQGAISCDDKRDYVAWRLDLDNPDHPGFNVMAVTKNAAGEIKVAFVNLPLDGSQYGLCTADGAPPPTVYLDERVDATLQKEIETPVCPQVIRVDDGLCDNIRLMWPKEDAGTEVPFIMHRN